jgi:hypothetical protein
VDGVDTAAPGRRGQQRDDFTRGPAQHVSRTAGHGPRITTPRTAPPKTAPGPRTPAPRPSGRPRRG